jgi:chromosome segregation ATPase
MEPTAVLQWGAYATGIGAVIGLVAIGARISNQVQITKSHAEQVPALKEDIGRVKSDVEDVKAEIERATKKIETLQTEVRSLDLEFGRHQTLVAVTTAETRASVKVAESTAVEIKTELRTLNERLTKMIEEMGGMKEAIRRMN